MSKGYVSSTIDAVLGWAQASSLRYLSINTGCCADELLQAVGCRYDLERFGALPETDPEFADLLVVSGAITTQAAPELRKVYDRMPSPKFVLVVGSCACSGGAFGPEATEGRTLAGVGVVLPVDILVPGCPPRPEAIIDGVIALQRKIRGKKVRLKREPRKPDRVDVLTGDEWGHV